jgi:hypothetical protein
MTASFWGRLFLPVFVSVVFSSAPVKAQGQQAPILAKGADNAAVGLLSSWDFGSTDVTFKSSTSELWVVDAYDDLVPFINKFAATDLTRPPLRVNIALPQAFATAPVMGIAEIVVGEFRGQNLLLIDPTFGSGGGPPQPLFGVFDDSGKQAPGTDFVAPLGLDPTSRLSAIDVSPTEERIAAYDNANHAFYILNFSFETVMGPVPALGDVNAFADEWFFGQRNRQGLRGGGMGIAYNGPDHLLVSGGFINTFETHLALEYDLTQGGVYSGKTMDLGAAGINGLNPDLAFLGMDTGKVGPEDALFALNVSDDSLYAFRVSVYQDVAPVQLTSCGADDITGLYQVTWALDPSFSADNFHIFENGVEVATVPSDQTTFQSSRPLLGKAFLEVVTEKGGLLSSLRPVCQVENSRKPRLDGVQFDGAQITNLGLMSAVAVTRVPATAADFRGYVMGFDTNSVEVVDHTLTTLEVIQMNPSVVTQGSNLAALGLALIHFAGQDRLAILDPDGPLNNNVPSAAIYSLEPPNRGLLFQRVDTIDLSQVTPTPFLYDWDSDDSNNFVAGGELPSGDLVLVRIEFDGTNMLATQMVPIPQRSLTPFDEKFPVGVGVSILPSGNLLVAGGDTFSKTYTEAILTTPFTSDPSTSVKIVGYAQGLPVPNQFFGFGPHVGPSVIYGMDTAYFAPEEGRDEAIGVTYLPAGRVDEIANPATGQLLGFRGNLLIHSENACSNPDLKAEQLAETTLNIGAGLESSTSPLSPSFLGNVSSTDYFVYILNQDKAVEARLSVDVKLDGTAVPEGNQTARLAPGRYLRISLTARSQRNIALSITNQGTVNANLKVILGAMGIGGAPAKPLFRRGDCNGDASIQLTDAVFMLNWLFKGGTEPSCVDACDADDNGAAGLTDPIIILNYLFRGGGEPASPGPKACGEDPSNDDTLKACSYPPASCQ